MKLKFLIIINAVILPIIGLSQTTTAPLSLNTNDSVIVWSNISTTYKDGKAVSKTLQIAIHNGSTKPIYILDSVHFVSIGVRDSRIVSQAKSAFAVQLYDDTHPGCYEFFKVMPLKTLRYSFPYKDAFAIPDIPIETYKDEYIFEVIYLINLKDKVCNKKLKGYKDYKKIICEKNILPNKIQLDIYHGPLWWTSTRVSNYIVEKDSE